MQTIFSYLTIYFSIKNRPLLMKDIVRIVKSPTDFPFPVSLRIIGKQTADIISCSCSCIIFRSGSVQDDMNDVAMIS